MDILKLFDHTPFISLREEVMALFDQQAAHDEIDTKLSELIKHLEVQFSAEEQAMLAVGFKPHDAHKAEHDRVLTKLAYRIEQWQKRREIQLMLGYIEIELADWFVKHVNTRDFITHRYIAAHLDSQ
ncbi:MAG: hemerythrin family protein [Sideroxydans sp.]|nr:hemerythrin family protein [Sideroxydans sp.]